MAQNDIGACLHSPRFHRHSAAQRRNHLRRLACQRRPTNTRADFVLEFFRNEVAFIHILQHDFILNIHFDFVDNGSMDFHVKEYSTNKLARKFKREKIMI